jgi:hypothetical protein
MSKAINTPKPFVQSGRLSAFAKRYAPTGTTRGWQAIAGKAKGSSAFLEAMMLGAKWRAQASAAGI